MKKFVKGLIVCGFVVSLLAACDTKKASEGSSGTCPEPTPCPEPQPAPVKEAWSDFESRMFELTGLAELPFGFELSLQDYDDTGILYATSKAEASEDDVEAYADLLEATGKYSVYDAGTSDGLSMEVAMLGFDVDAEMFQYYRPHLDNDESFYTDVVTVGLDEDGFLRVAAVEAYLPYYAYMGPGATNGTGIYTLEFTHATAGVIDFYNLLYGDIICSLVGGNYSQTLPTLNAGHPEIETDVTCGAFFNYGVGAPYFYGNPSSDYFTADYIVSFIKGIDEETKEIGSYSEAEYEAVLDDALAAMAVETYPDEPELDWDYGYLDDAETPDPAKGVWFYYSDLQGHAIEITYSLDEVQIGSSVVNTINIEFEPQGFELPVRGRPVACAIGETITLSAQYMSSYEAMGYYISAGLLGEASEEYDEDDAMLDVDWALIEMYLDDELDTYDAILADWSYNSSQDNYYKEVYFNNNDEELRVLGAIFVSEQEVAEDTFYWTFTVQLQQATRTSVEGNYDYAIAYGAYQAAARGLISMQEYYAFSSISSLFDYCETFEELDAVYDDAAQAFRDSLHIGDLFLEDLLDLVGRVDPMDFYDETEEDFSEVFYDLYDAYEEVELDLTDSTYIFKFLPADMVVLYNKLNAAVAVLRAAYYDASVEELNGFLEALGEDNYDPDDWAAILAEVDDFLNVYAYEDCYNSEEIIESLELFEEYILEEYPTWAEKYDALFAELLEEYEGREAEYEEGDWTALQQILSDGQEALEAATDAASAKVAYETARDDAAAIPTILDTYKEQAKDLVEDYIDVTIYSHEYDEEFHDEMVDTISAACAAIDTADSKDEVDSIVAEAEEALLDLVKAAAKAELDAWMKDDGSSSHIDRTVPETFVDGQDGLDAANAAIAEAKEAIDAATTQQEVLDARDAGWNAVGAIAIIPAA